MYGYVSVLGNENELLLFFSPAPACKAHGPLAYAISNINIGSGFGYSWVALRLRLCEFDSFV
jgi:hypothetical protein